MHADTPSSVPKKKRQHYVPRLLLRRFSSDDRRISVLILSAAKRLDGVGLKEQCYENYFYDRDGVLETYFSSSEAKFSAALGDLSDARLEALTDDELLQLKFFVHYQRLRTVGAAEQVNQLSEEAAKTLMPRGPNLERLPEFDAIRVRMTHPQLFAVRQAMTTTPLLMDLEVKFLVSDRPLGLVLSDDPVIVYNQYAEHHPVHGPPLRPGGTTGLAMKGLQLFLPVSPRVCIAVFDPGTYQYGSPAKRVVRLGLGDIRLLNTMQVANAAKCIYFDARTMTDAEITRLLSDRTKLHGWRAPQITQTPLEPRGDGTYRSVMLNEIPDLRVGKRLCCVKVLKSDADHLLALPSRQPDPIGAVKGYERFLEQKAAEKAASKKAAPEEAVSNARKP